jgi:NhaA family Na+:H+ antiporter
MPILFLKRRFITYLQEFIHDSRAIGIILLVNTVLALLLANSPWGNAFIGAITTEFEFLHHWHLPHSALHFINDGLMAVFFFLVGMEIKRELVMGELSSVKRAILPIGAAVGGMIVPAVLYVFFNKGGQFQQGWGVPTATDIAFSLGIASMLGKKFPANLKIFLMALAIIDDLGAILVIAFFYGGAIKGMFLLLAGFILLLLYFMNRRKMTFGAPHFILGILLWYCLFNSGIHATIAGVLLAFMVPDKQLAGFEMKFHNPVNFFILPVFALVNTAIVVNGDMLQNAIHSTLAWGVFVGLVIGKPVGITLACWLLVRKKAAVLPRGIDWYHIVGAGILAGIGFTMSIFITALAFGDAIHQDISKMAILIGALVSVLLGFGWFSAGFIRKLFAVQEAPEEEAA